MLNIEEPYHNTGLSFIDYNEHCTIYYIRWTDEHGKDQSVEINDDEADKWLGYALLFELNDEEILILK